MGVIAGIATALASVVGSVVATIGAIVASAVTAVVVAVSAVVTTVISTVGSIVSSITSAFTGEVLHTTVMVDGIAVPIEIANQTMFTTLSAWASSIKAGFSGFLTAIHFDTIITIHEIAHLTSSAYREMMQKVYGKLGDFSEAIGRTTGFIETAIQLARKTSLEVSSFLGKSYDLGEVVWLKSFRSLLDKINDTAIVYAKNPSQIWTDIDDIIVKPAIDAKAAAQVTMFATVRNAVDMVKSLDDSLTTVQADFVATVSHLPKQWQNDILTMFVGVSGEINEWREGIFAPTIEVIDKVMGVVYERTIKAKELMQQIAARLAKGGDILADIDNLPDAERLEQELKIAEVSTRIMRRKNALWLQELQEHVITLESIKAAIKFEPSPSIFIVADRPALVTPVGKQAKDKKSWFVGDY